MKIYRGIGYWYSIQEPWFPHPKDLIINYSEDVKIKLLQYLEAADICSYSRGFSECRLCQHSLGGEEKTDGDYVFPVGLIHYVEIHNVGVPQSFLEKALSTKRICHVNQMGNDENNQYYKIDFSWWLQQTTGQTPIYTVSQFHGLYSNKNPQPTRKDNTKYYELELFEIPELQNYIKKYESVLKELQEIIQKYPLTLENMAEINFGLEKTKHLFNIIHNLGWEKEKMLYDISRLKESERNKLYDLFNDVGKFFYLQLSCIKSFEEDSGNIVLVDHKEKLKIVRTIRPLLKYDSLLFQILTSYEHKLLKLI